MTNTPELIDALVESAEPVRRLRPPLTRAALWLLFAIFVLGLIGITHGVRSDIYEQLQQPAFVVGMFGALATGVLAAVASFRISLPDGSRFWFLLPLLPLALWVSTIGYGCFTDLDQHEPRWRPRRRGGQLFRHAPYDKLTFVHRAVDHAPVYRVAAFDGGERNGGIVGRCDYVVRIVLVP